VAIKDHAAQAFEAHPSSITIDRGTARCAHLPLQHFPVATETKDGGIVARDGGPVEWDWNAIGRFWNADYGVSGGVLMDFYSALTQRFVRRLRVADPDSIASIKGRPVLYLCNHQVDIESPLFNFLAPAVLGTPIQTISRTEHLQSWVGKLDQLASDYPGMNRLKRILYFDRSDPAALFKVLERYRETLRRENCSLMVHVEGELALTCRSPVTRLSSVFIDLAMQLNLPIVPVRFIGGLPTQPLRQTVPFPIGHGRQDYVCGKPIFPGVLAEQQLSDRIATVISALNAIPPASSVELPLPGETEFVSAVEARIQDGNKPRTAIVFETISRAQQSFPALAAVHEALTKHTTPADVRLAALLFYLRYELEQG
jgi:1-acyl-sn-glycerol-3-phosphate acyltransferase